MRRPSCKLEQNGAARRDAVAGSPWNLNSNLSSRLSPTTFKQDSQVVHSNKLNHKQAAQWRELSHSSQAPYLEGEGRLCRQNRRCHQAKLPNPTLIIVSKNSSSSVTSKFSQSNPPNSCSRHLPPIAAQGTLDLCSIDVENLITLHILHSSSSNSHWPSSELENTLNTL